MSRWKTIGQRFGLIRINDAVLKRRVPETPWFLGDGAALSLLLLAQIITGIAMTVYYVPAGDQAYDSVHRITTEIPLGRLVRGIHYWSAGLMVAMLCFHGFRHVLLGGYKAPREGTWTIGIFLFFLVLTMSFTGYVLRWDEDAVYAAGIVLNIFHHVPVIGDELIYLLQGGPRIASATLTRFYSIHIWLVPILLIAFFGYHLYLVIIHGVTHRAEWKKTIKTAQEQKREYQKAAQTEERGEWFYPDTVFASSAFAFAVFCFAFALALFAGPPPLHPPANLIDPSMPAEEWWFAWYSALIALLPPVIAPAFETAIPLVAFAAMLLLPLLDRGPNRGIKRRPIWAAFIVLITLGLLWLSDLRRRSPWTGWPEPNPPPIPNTVSLSSKAEEGRRLFARYGCNSCHSISSHGRSFGPDLARLEHPLSPSELQDYILQPPKGIPMPPYRDHILEGDLEKVVDFVLAAQTFPRRY